MPYEVVIPAERDERGRVFDSLTEAMVAATVRDEVWQLADDDAQTRVCMCWPDTEFQPRVTLDPTTLENVTPITHGKADRYATAMLSQYPVTERGEIHALVSLAYATGNRDGYAECARDAERILGRMFSRRQA